MRIENIFTAYEKDFFDADDFAEMTCSDIETANKIIQRIKSVSDIFGIDGLVHHVDYAEYIQHQLNNGVHTEE